MQPRTLAALAVATGLILGSAVLALGATLMPSSAAPRPYVPAVADAPADPGTTIVADVQTVYDAPVAAPTHPSAPAPASNGPAPEPRASAPAPAPATTTLAPRPKESDDVGDDSHESSSSSSSSQIGPIDG